MTRPPAFLNKEKWGRNSRKVGKPSFLFLLFPSLFCLLLPPGFILLSSFFLSLSGKHKQQQGTFLQRRKRDFPPFFSGNLAKSPAGRETKGRKSLFLLTVSDNGRQASLGRGHGWRILAMAEAPPPFFLRMHPFHARRN